MLDDAGAGSVLFHGALSIRVGGAWAIVQARRGKSLEDALAAGREAGLKGATIEDAVRRLVGPKTP